MDKGCGSHAQRKKNIGACSCGFEPDLFHTTPKGTIVHALQIFRLFHDQSVGFAKEQDIKEVK
jgi:hypothetical protein